MSSKFNHKMRSGYSKTDIPSQMFARKAEVNLVKKNLMKMMKKAGE